MSAAPLTRWPSVTVVIAESAVVARNPCFTGLPESDDPLATSPAQAAWVAKVPVPTTVQLRLAAVACDTVTSPVPSVGSSTRIAPDAVPCPVAIDAPATCVRLLAPAPAELIAHCCVGVVGSLMRAVFAR